MGLTGDHGIPQQDVIFINNYMRKLIVIFLTIGIIILVVVLIIRGRSNKLITTAPKITKTSITPFVRPTVIVPSGAKFKISEVEINNIYISPVKINPEKDVLLIDNKDYQIGYLALFKKFTITIYSSNFETTRKIAEEEFLNKLEINKEEACKLEVEVNPSNSTTDQFAGKSFPLSFCLKTP